MKSAARYDTVGRNYTDVRQPDPRIADLIGRSLKGARSIVNVGAGTGSYEPQDRTMTAVEPSEVMIDQRATDASPVVRATAESLPFEDLASDAAMAIMTIHHWDDVDLGLSEMNRVAHRQCLHVFDRTTTEPFWLTEYLPFPDELVEVSTRPWASIVSARLNDAQVEQLLIPRDCTDGFTEAYWARPEAYLDPKVQAGTSWLSMLPADDLVAGLNRLADDLRSGAWDRRHGHLRTQDWFDGGHRIVVGGS